MEAVSRAVCISHPAQIMLRVGPVILSDARKALLCLSLRAAP